MAKAVLSGRKILFLGCITVLVLLMSIFLFSYFDKENYKSITMLMSKSLSDLSGSNPSLAGTCSESASNCNPGYGCSLAADQSGTCVPISPDCSLNIAAASNCSAGSACYLNSD